MKVLILTVTAGYGHHATAKAVSDVLEERNVAVRMIDFFKYVSKPMYDTVDKGYLFSTKYMPKRFGQVYAALEKNRVQRKNTLSLVVTELVGKKFLSIFDDFNPDIIVCTHIFCAMVLNELKIMGKLSCPVIGIITDYTIHPFWDEVPNIEYIVTGSSLLNYRAEKKGLTKDRILPFGIPLQAKFRTGLSKKAARELLGLDPDKFTILCMSGSMGFGHITASIQALNDMNGDFQLLCVCGNNDKAFRKLNRMSFRKDFRVFGFVNNINEMMDAADCIITKPGGLTTTECMQKHLPMILTDPIPGQEVRNSEFLSNCGAAIVCSNFFPVDEAVDLLLHSPERRQLLSSALEILANPNAASDLADFILNYPI